MPDTFTPFLNLCQPEVGGSTDSWGQKTNQDWTIVDQFAEKAATDIDASFTAASNADQKATAANTKSDEAIKIANEALSTAQSGVPTGTILQFAAAAAPKGWLVCDGTAVSRVTYKALFDLIGTTYGAGDGSNTFNLPAMGGRSPVGVGAGYALAAKGGSRTGKTTGTVTVAGTSLTEAQLPAHKHTATDSGHSHTVSDPGHGHGINDPQHYHVVTAAVDGGGTFTFASQGGNFNIGKVLNTNASNCFVTVQGAKTGVSIANGAANITVGNTGSGQTHTHTATFTGTDFSIEPPYLVLNFIIKA